MLEPLQVLVISADLQARAEHVRAVQRLGHVPNALGQTREALQRRGRRPPSVILFGPEAWKDGGAELVDQLLEVQKPTRVILVADQRSLAKAPQYYDEGVQLLLQTPLSTAELDEAINELMAGPPARSELPTPTGETDAADESLSDEEPVDEVDPERVREQIIELAGKLREGTAEITNISPVAMELQALCADGTGSLGGLVAKIEQDPNLCVSVLKASNAAAYRGMPSVLDLHAAGRRLGTRRLAEVAQMEALKGAFVSKNKGWSKLLSKMWRNTVTTANAARLLVERIGWSNRGEVYTMALFHNLGEILVVDLHKSLGTTPPRHGLATGALARDMEAQHAELGALLMRSWKLPPTLAAIAYAHHDPTRLERGTPLSRHAWLLGGVHKAVVEAGYTYLKSHSQGPSVDAAAGVLGIQKEWIHEAAAEAIRIWTGQEE